jgi:Mlc titration factor MtfA (ptsG expression regulator)
MVTILQIFFVMILLVLLILFVYRPKRIKGIVLLPNQIRPLLNDHIKFYQRLNEEGKKIFEEKIQKFLHDVRITGVTTIVEDFDRILIAAGAVIPVYSFRDWEYTNLHEVLLYPGIFSEEFEQEGYYRSISGMVGSGPMQNVMIISKADLRRSFIDNYSTRNTAIHEFVHLIDKMDGTMDGIPEILLERKHINHWLHVMNETIQQIKNEESDIDMYGATSQAEFFAVASEYFFEQPGQLKANHPQLFEILERIFLRR